MNNDHTVQPLIPLFADNRKGTSGELNKNTAKLKELPKSLNIGGKQIPLSSKQEEIIHIYKTIVAALQSDWHSQQGEYSIKLINTTLKMFIPWLSCQSVSIHGRYSILKNYETYRVNDQKVKPQSTGLYTLIPLLKEGLSSDVIDPGTLRYMEMLLNSTTLSLPDQRVSFTLTGYFSSISWLRGTMQESDYLRLESPKRLMESFSITIATTLNLIIEAKKSIPENIKSINFNERYSHIKEYRHRLLRWSQFIFLELGKFKENGDAADILTEMMRVDLLGVDYPAEPLTSSSYRIPRIFHPDYLCKPSHLEELLCAWLCAWLAIQPSDIEKLKKNNFVISRNNLGRPLSIQCVYYKGRGGRDYETPMLVSDRVEGFAIQRFLDFLPADKTYLFEKIKLNRLSLSPGPTLSYRFFKLFECKLIYNEIKENIKARHSSEIFLKAVLSMAKNGGESFGAWEKNERGDKRSIEAYRKTVKNNLPLHIFGLEHIKNSSVHSRTDMYRDGDFANQNSHTSQTEKTSYLTDANKEWINQHGRLTRMVLDDLESIVFKPSLNHSINIANDTIIRTKVADVDCMETTSINLLGQITNLKDEFYDEPDEIIVLDTPETVVNMLHYVAEAERQYTRLIEHAPLFFESTVLPNVEWMHFVLEQKLSPSIVKNGLESYEKVRHILPELFSSELNGGVAS